MPGKAGLIENEVVEIGGSGKRATKVLLRAKQQTPCESKRKTKVGHDLASYGPRVGIMGSAEMLDASQTLLLF